MIVFEGDFVQLKDREAFERVVEIGSNDDIVLADGTRVPAPIEDSVETVRSAREHADALWAEIIEVLEERRISDEV